MSNPKDFSFRALTINVRNARLTGPSWISRRRPLVAWIKKLAPSIVYFQEVNEDQYKDLQILFGKEWEFAVSQNCVVGWLRDKWRPVQFIKKTLVGPQSRGFVGVKLERKGSDGGWVWACSTHLSANRPDAPLWRKKQVEQIAGFFSPKEIPWVQIGADLNSRRTPPRRGARYYFQKIGLVHLRGKLRTSELIGEEYNTFQGFQVTKQKGIWLDDILTGREIHPYMGRVELSGKIADHNGVKSSSLVSVAGQPALLKAA